MPIKLLEAWKRYREMVVNQPEIATPKECLAAMMGFYAGGAVVLDLIIGLTIGPEEEMSAGLRALMKELSQFPLAIQMARELGAEEKRSGRDAQGKGDDAEGFRGGGSAGGGLPN